MNILKDKAKNKNLKLTLSNNYKKNQNKKYLQNSTGFNIKKILSTI